MLVRLKMFSHSEITKFALLDYSAKVLKNKQKTRGEYKRKLDIHVVNE